MSVVITAEPCIRRFQPALHGWRTVTLSEVLVLIPQLHGAMASPLQEPPVGSAAQW